MTTVLKFKDAFSSHPTGIALITATTPDGPVGLTASSVTSVSLDPLALAFSVTRATGSAGGILDADSFVVHLLDGEHLDTARQFAYAGGERFTDEQNWETLETGEPHLIGARAAFRCTTVNSVPVGDSTVVVAEVHDVLAGRRGTPLVYLDRSFVELSSEFSG